MKSSISATLGMNIGHQNSKLELTSGPHSTKLFITVNMDLASQHIINFKNKRGLYKIKVNFTDLMYNIRSIFLNEHVKNMSTFIIKKSRKIATAE